MAKSLRSKVKKRLRTLRREIVEPFYDKKDVAKFAAQEAALAAPKVPVRTRSDNNDDGMTIAAITTGPSSMDVEMVGGESPQNQNLGSFLKPSGGIGKKLKNKLKFKKNKRHAKGKAKKRY